jgi:hypothetical protein
MSLSTGKLAYIYIKKITISIRCNARAFLLVITYLVKENDLIPPRDQTRPVLRLDSLTRVPACGEKSAPRGGSHAPHPIVIL